MSVKVFISHSHQDNDLCAPLLEALNVWDIDYWFDTGRLTAGNIISDKIETAIRERHIFLRICTPAAMESRYMARERDFFLKLQDDDQRTQTPSRRALIPLILALPYDGGLPEASVKHISAVNRPRSQWLEELRKALSVSVSSGAGQRHSVPAADSLAATSTPAKFPALVAMLREMDAAIAAELEKVNRSTVGHIAVDGQLIGRVGGQYLYSFVLREPWEPQDDAPIRVKLTQRHLEAAIVTSSGNKVTIAVNQQLPPDALRQVTLVDDPRRLLEKQREALGEAEEYESQLASKTFGLLPASTGLAALPPLPPPSQFAPNASQERAIRQALGNEVSYIIGPPGTGKTASLAAIAYALVQAGHTVLIAAHTNIAVDNAILKLAEYTDGLPELREGRIVRFGPPQLAAVRAHNDIYPPNIAKRVGRDLDAQRAGLQARRAKALAQLQAAREANTADALRWRAERARHNSTIRSIQIELGPLQQQEQARVQGLQVQLAQARRDTDVATKGVNAAKKALAQLVEHQSRLNSERERLQSSEAEVSSHLFEAQRMNPLVRFARRISPDKLVHQLSDLKQTLWQIEQSLEVCREPLEHAHAERARAEQARDLAERRGNDFQNELQKPSQLAGRIHELQHVLQQALSSVDTGDARQKKRDQEQEAQQQVLERDLERLNVELADIEAWLTTLERDIVANAQVVATTLSKLYMGATLRERRFNTVILDEVSIAPLPAVYIAAAQALANVIAIGDPKQLSPILQAQNDATARKWLGRDLFEVAKVSLDSAAGGDPRSVLLDEQFRMHPEISVIARNHVYDGLLRDGKQPKENARGYDSVLPLPGKPLMLCDTSDAHPLTARPESGKGKYNEYHVLCVLTVAKQVLSSLPPTRDLTGESKFRIGIVTPYRAQAQRLQRAVKADQLVESVRVGTVHSFQGLEFEVVIFDTVESPPFKPVPDFTAGRKGSKAMRLVNVAVTRPQHKLIIVANLTYLKANLGDSDTLILAVEEARKAAVVKSTETLDMAVAPGRIRGIRPA